MITVAELKAPYTEFERADFVVEWNHTKGYEIEEDENSIRALGYDETEQAEREILAQAEDELKEKEVALTELKDSMAMADLQGDEDLKAELREEYTKLMRGE